MKTNHMKNIVSKTLSFFIVTGIVFVLSVQVSAMGGWIRNTSHAPYKIDHVCRDGVQITAVVNPVEEGPGGKTVNIDDVHLINGEYDSSFLEDSNIAVKDEYLTQIGHGMLLNADVAQTESITGYNGTQTISYTTTILPFVFEPAPGSIIFVENNGSYLIADNFSAVEDCRFFDYPADQDHTFTHDKLLAPSAQHINPAGLYFTVEQLPVVGQVQLDGSQILDVGDSYTQDEFATAGNTLTYVAPDQTEGDQVIKLSVSGLDRLTNANGDSYKPSISADGSYVSFTSDATDLTSLSTGGFSQVYRGNLSTSSIDPISLNAAQTELGNGSSDNSVISPTGSKIAYSSFATTLIDVNDTWCMRRADTNFTKDVFLWQNNFAAQQRISTFQNSGVCQESPLISDHPAIADERTLNVETAHQTFSQLPYSNYADNNGELDIVAFDGSYNEAIYDTANNTPIIIIPTVIVPTVIPTLPPIIAPREDQTGQAAPQATPQAPNGASLDPDISADGNVIAYESFATDLIRTFLGDPADTNGLADIYASVRNESDDGWYVRRISINSNGEATTGGDSRNPTVSMYGDHVAFQSKATNLDPAATTGNWQIFVRDRGASCTTLLSIHTNGTLGNGDSTDPSISANGRFVAFTSKATNLIDGDTNGFTDIFVIDRDADETGAFYTDESTCTPSPSRTFRVSVAADGTQGDGDSYEPDISLNGEFIAFTSDATTLVANDLNGYSDIFVHYTGYTREISLGAASNTYPIYLPAIVAP